MDAVRSSCSWVAAHASHVAINPAGWSRFSSSCLSCLELEGIWEKSGRNLVLSMLECSMFECVCVGLQCESFRVLDRIYNALRRAKHESEIAHDSG